MQGDTNDGPTDFPLEHARVTKDTNSDGYGKLGEEGSQADTDVLENVPGSHFGFSPGVMVMLFTLLEFLIYFDRGALAVSLLTIRDQQDISQFAGGVLGGAYLAGYCLSAPFFAILANRVQPLKLCAFGMLFWCGATALCGFQSSYAVLLTARILTGIGESSFLSLASTIIDVISPQDKRSSWLALFYAAIPMGYAVGEALGGVIVDSGLLSHNRSWRLIFIGEGCLALSIVLTFACVRGPANMLVLDPSRAKTDDDSACTKFKKLLGNPTYVVTVFAYAAQTFTIGGISFYCIEYLQEEYFDGGHAQEAGMIFGGLTVFVGGGGTILGGMVLDRVKKKANLDEGAEGTVSLMPIAKEAIWMSLCFMACSLPAGLIYPFIHQLEIVCVLVAILLLLVFMSLGPINNSIMWSVPLEDRTFAMAVTVLVIHAFGDAAAPVLLGAIQDSLGWKWTMFIGYIPCVLCTILLVFSYHYAKKAIRRDTMRSPLISSNGLPFTN